MPGTTLSEPPSVSLSFANNFWGKDDAGVSPLLERMHNAKVTCDELKSFYTTRASIEEEYARKLLNLSRKPLGSSEAGTLRMSLDVIRAEVEAIGKSHQNIAGQMKSELEEPLAAFAGGMKERRKIVQTGVEKLWKVKTQQTNSANKSRDKYEQDCLKIKGYLAQGHMVMGQEERKNKAKLEKTQIQLSTASNEYETAIKALEETTGRWNRDWKAACDKFQDLEEERIDFMKSSLWSFANIASTVCVSDDASCEKIRLSLEDCDVEKDITNFIHENGTGQEIPDAPKFINFCRGDVTDNASDISDEGSYSVAQFQRTMNPIFRSSSPQPSTYESHHDPQSSLAKQLGPDSAMEADRHHPNSNSNATIASAQQSSMQTRHRRPTMESGRVAGGGLNSAVPGQGTHPLQMNPLEQIPAVPHNEYPMDGMTQFCRIGAPSQRSSNASPARPSSRGSQSDYSAPTSMSSVEPHPVSASHSPTKGMMSDREAGGAAAAVKKQSGFFHTHSPFTHRHKQDKESPQKDNAPINISPTKASGSPFALTTGRGVYHPDKSSGARSHIARGALNAGSGVRDTHFDMDRQSVSPEPVDPRANFQLNVGNNVFDVASPDIRRKPARAQTAPEELDPIAQALAELKGVTKQASVRMSADRYHGLSTPAPPGTPGNNGDPLGGVGSGSAGRPSAYGAGLSSSSSAVRAAQRGTPPPSYDQPISRLGAPEPAFTSKAMQQTTQKYVEQKKNMFNSPSAVAPPGGRRSYDTTPRGSAPNSASRPNTRGSTSGQEAIARSASPVPRSTSPRPALYGDPSYQSQRQPPQQYQQQHSQAGYQHQPYRATSPNPYMSRPKSTSPVKPQGGMSGGRSSYGRYNSRHNSPQAEPPMPRATSPQPMFHGAQQQQQQQQGRPGSSRGGADMSLQLAAAPVQNGLYGRGGGAGSVGSNGRPGSSYYSGNGSDLSYNSGVSSTAASRPRSHSGVESRQCTKDGRIILQYSRAMYLYQAAIPEELSFAKGDILAILRLQDDGWWEAEVVGKGGQRGLVPSNYLQNV